jgi:autotransporter-associated beta strand protein
MQAHILSPRRLLPAVIAVLCLPGAAVAQTFFASDAATLSTAISNASSSGGTIVFTNNITLTSSLPTIDLSGGNITVEGGNYTLSGASTYQGLTVSNSLGLPNSATLQNLTIANTTAAGGTGGAGGAGAAGGGGGAGMGGALLIQTGASVSVNNVSLVSNSAVGGAGGIGSSSVGFGTGGNGGGFNATGFGGGAGGIGGSTPNGFNSTAFGGGGGGAASPSAPGGNGSFNVTVGPPSAGGAGGSTNGTAATSLFGGGSGGTAVGGVGAGGGGGGAALGGGVFVQSGGQLTITGPFTVNGNSVTGGAGGAGGGGGSAGASGSALGGGLFLDGGTLSVSTSSNVALMDAIGGDNSASVQKSGSGTLVLGGNNTFTGGVTVNAGTLSVSSNSNLGSGGTVDLSDGTTLAVTASGTYTHDVQLGVSQGATISPSGGQTVVWNGQFFDGDSPPTALFVNGGGTLVLGNTLNSYGGGTVVTGNSTVSVASDPSLGATTGGVALGDASSSGTLAITSSGAFSSARPISLGAGGGTIATSGGTNAALLGAISGGGGLTKSGGGSLTLFGNNTYSGPTTALGGTLRAGSASAFGTSGALAIGGGATVDLNGFNFSLASLTGGGTLALGGGSQLTLGSNGSSFAFDGSLVGTGSLVKDGGGTLTLGGVNSYSGGTLISGGTLVGNSASLQGTIINNSALIFNQTGTGSFNGTMLGTGSLTKSGPGTLIVDGTNLFSGNLTIGEGTLALNGSFGGNVNIGAAGTLRGAGLIGGSLNLGGSLFVPGATGSAASNALRLLVRPRQTAAAAPSLIINGNLTATPGSLLDFTVTPNGAAPIVVRGLATLTSSRVSVTVVDPNPARYTTYLGLTSNGLTVNGLQASSPTPGIVPVLTSDPNNLLLTVLNEKIPLGGIASSPNASGVGGALDRLKPKLSGDLAFVVSELTALDDASLDNALRQIAGEVHSTELRLSIDEANLVSDLVRDVLSGREGDEQPGARRTTGAASMRMWFQLTGDHAHYSPAGVDGATANSGGGGGGLDFRPSPNVILGGGGSFSLADMSMSGLGGSSNMQAPRAFGYSGYSAGPFGFHLGGSAAKTTYTTQRQINFAATVPSPTGEKPLSEGVDRVADASQGGIAKDTWTELDDTFRRGAWTHTWKIGWRAATYDRNPFTETGADSLSLVGLAETLKTKEADVNINSYKRTGSWRPNVRISYRRELADRTTTSGMQLGDQAAGEFQVSGVPIPVDEFHGIFGLTLRTFGLEYTIEYETRRAKDENHQGVHFRARF